MTIPTIVTLDQLQSHLKLAAIDDEDDLQQKLNAATQMVCEHIADRQPADLVWVAEIEAWHVDDGSSPANPAPPLVILAVLNLAADYYRFHGDDAGDDRQREFGWMPKPVVNMLVRYRSPSLS